MATGWVVWASVFCCVSFRLLSFHFPTTGSQIHLLEMNVGNNVKKIEQAKRRLESAKEGTSKDESEQLPRAKMTEQENKMIDMEDTDCPFYLTNYRCKKQKL